MSDAEQRLEAEEARGFEGAYNPEFAVGVQNENGFTDLSMHGELTVAAAVNTAKRRLAGCVGDWRGKVYRLVEVATVRREGGQVTVEWAEVEGMQ